MNRHVGAELVRAHHRALELFSAMNRSAPGISSFDAERHHADDRGRAAEVEHGEGLLGGRLDADGLEAVVDAAAGELLTASTRRRPRAALTTCGGAELLGVSSFSAR